jgi:excinuclease ABC subunit C
MVCCVNGMPQKNRYRLFRIKTVEGIDDPAMMAEVIRRRYGRVKAERGELPSLVLVDGGVTQVRAARAELDALGLKDLPAAGLAKRYEELYRDRGKGPPAKLPLDSDGLKVLQQIRDEAHRFALTYHRKLRSKRIRESLLDEIPGIGKKRKTKILEHFGSVRRLARASAEEIAGVPGIGPEMAREIHAALSPDA